MKRGNLVRTLQVRVDKTTADRLRKQARKEDVPESQIVRRVLRSYLEEALS